MITLQFDDGCLEVRKRLLEECQYFIPIFRLNSEETVISMIDYRKSRKNFKHVLNFLITGECVIPSHLHHEIDFYGVDYPKYDLETSYNVTLIVEGVEFKLTNFLDSHAEI